MSHKRVTSLLYIILLISVVAMVSLTGCQKTGARVVLTTDFNENEVFRIEDMICTKAEIMVYLVNIENNYSSVFGDEIWEVPYEDGTVESQYKESVLARLAQIKAMNLFAAKEGVTLSESEESLVKNAAASYFDTLNEDEIRFLGADIDLIEQMYREYAVANKLYGMVTESVNPEISDDEARSIVVKSILIKTYKIDLRGNRIDYSENEKITAYKKAAEIYRRIKAGEDFDIIAADYNEDENQIYTFGRGVMPKEIEECAYNMSEGEISDIITTEYGYHILKCISNFDEESTDNNKTVIAGKRKEDAFTEKYDDFIKSLTSNLNKDLWDSISYMKSRDAENIRTTNFFSIYDNYFSNAAG